jgi:hypothetical protein
MQLAIRHGLFLLVLPMHQFWLWLEGAVVEGVQVVAVVQVDLTIRGHSH